MNEPFWYGFIALSHENRTYFNTWDIDIMVENGTLE